MDDLLAIILLLSLSIYRTARHRFEILYTLKLNLVLPPRRFPSRILFRSCIKIGFSNQWLPKKGSTTNHDSQALPTLYPTLCLYYRKTLWTQWPPSLCLYGKTRERTMCLCGKKIQTQRPWMLCLYNKTRLFAFTARQDQDLFAYTARKHEHNNSKLCAFTARQDQDLFVFTARKYKHNSLKLCALRARQNHYLFAFMAKQ